MPGGANDFEQAIRDVETALARLRRAGDEAAEDRTADLAGAERRLADLRAAHRAVQEASERLGTSASATLGEHGRRVVRLRREADAASTAPPADAASGGGATVDAGSLGARRGMRLLLAPAVVAVGVAGALLASLAVNAGIDPFRGQQLAPPPATAEGSGAAAPALALPPAGTVAKPRVRATRSAAERRAAKRARAGRTGAPTPRR